MHTKIYMYTYMKKYICTYTWRNYQSCKHMLEGNSWKMIQVLSPFCSTNSNNPADQPMSHYVKMWVENIVQPKRWHFTHSAVLILHRRGKFYMPYFSGEVKKKKKKPIFQTIEVTKPSMLQTLLCVRVPKKGLTSFQRPTTGTSPRLVWTHVIPLK